MKIQIPKHVCTVISHTFIERVKYNMTPEEKELMAKQLLLIEKTCYRIERDTIELRKKLIELEQEIKELKNANV